jgi:N-acetylglucosaminyldiphosphoundecaprenol N-acetyl-beta-D-mannosaminyltransferase
MNEAYSTQHCDGVSSTSTPASRKRLFQLRNKKITFDILKNKLTAMILPFRDTTLKPGAIPIPAAPMPDTDARIEHIDLLGVRVHLLTEDRLHNHIAKVIRQGRKELILNVNVHCYNMIFKSRWLKDFLNRANITFCDGAGVMLGAKIMGTKKIPQRITYADWMWNFSKFAEKEGYSFFFLGAKPGVAEKAAQKLQEQYPGLEISTHHGYFDKAADSAENQEVIEKINASKANILVLGFGMPIQEKWLEENQEKLDVNISLTGGAVFDYLSGELKRGPRCLVDNGMEWLARLLIEPKRLWKRYLVGNTVFIYKVIAKRLVNITREATAKARKVLTEIVTEGNEMLAQAAAIIISIIIRQPAQVAEINKKLDIITGRRIALRRHRRRKLNGYSAEIAKNGVHYNATINDVSPEGIQLGNIPSVLTTKQGEQLYITVSNLLGSTEYQLTVKTEWKKREGRRVTAAGFSIVNAPNDWKTLMP